MASPFPDDAVTCVARIAALQASYDATEAEAKVESLNFSQALAVLPATTECRCMALESVHEWYILLS